MKRLITLLVAISLYGCAVNVGGGQKSPPAAPAAESKNTEIEWLNPPGTDTTNRPYSTAVRVDNMLYLSGALGFVPETGKLAEGGIQPETRQTLENISATLEMFGSSMDRVVKCTVFLADIAEWGAMNEVYITFFPNKPARSAVGDIGLGLNARIEIECIAVID
ncbi:MAG: RidA family protein [Woeseiaceae bacterium]